MTRDKFLQIVGYIDEITKGTDFENHVFIVGGSVRDFVMGNDPKDIDIVLDIENGGIKFAEWVKEQNLTNTIVTYPTYGTSMFKFHKYPDHEIECVQTRKEQYKDKNSRNPETSFGTIYEDSIRRDLTINALYMKPDGTIIDPTGKGLDDLKNKVLRVTNDNPNVVFQDDPLRILRVIRFKVRYYDFNVDMLTFASMYDNADRLSIITKERIRDEFQKILMSKHATDGLGIIRYIGAMKYIIPELEQTYGLTQNAYHFGPVWDHTLALLDRYHDKFEPDMISVLACLLHDIGKIKTRSVGSDGRVHFYEHENETQLVEDILRRLKYDNNTIKEVCFIVKNHMRTKNFGDNCDKIKPKNLNKLIYTCKTRERFKRLIKVIECDNLSHNPLHNIYGQYWYFMKHLDSPMFGYKLPIDGNEIMSILDIEPGVEVKMIMDKLVKQAFSNPDINKEQCIKQLPHILKLVRNELKK